MLRFFMALLLMTAVFGGCSTDDGRVTGLPDDTDSNTAGDTDSDTDTDTDTDSDTDTDTDTDSDTDTDTDTDSDTDTGSPSSPFQVVGYFPDWGSNLNTTASNLEYNHLTHINYAFIVPVYTKDAGPSLRPLDNPDVLTTIVTKAHAANVTVSIAVGGYSAGVYAFEEISRNDTYRADFITQLVKFVDDNNLDGVDMDWEYPKDYSETWFDNLMVELGTALHAKGKILTAAVIAGEDGSPEAAAISDKVFGAVDYLNIMSYDGWQDGSHSSYNMAVDNLDYWINTRGLPPKKAMLGVPFYNLASNPVSVLEQKCDYVVSEGTAGVMIWEISTNPDSRLGIIYDKLFAK
ncbi:MAG: hypothetical protein JXR91_16905 [Deltaproteobacteria bacterium]|nr:hypothetical protein [Deltaproteobacteria bacterium]